MHCWNYKSLQRVMLTPPMLSLFRPLTKFARTARTDRGFLARRRRAAQFSLVFGTESAHVAVPR